jgi:hypothetical protein
VQPILLSPSQHLDAPPKKFSDFCQSHKLWGCLVLDTCDRKQPADVSHITNKFFSHFEMLTLCPLHHLDPEQLGMSCPNPFLR